MAQVLLETTFRSVKDLLEPLLGMQIRQKKTPAIHKASQGFQVLRAGCARGGVLKASLSVLQPEQLPR